MGKAKLLTKEDILLAIKRTKSNRGAARFLHVSYPHYKRYAKLYKDESGVSLFELHKNPSGKGIPKFLTNKGKQADILDIIEGRIPIEHFTPEKIKSRLIAEGFLEERCSRCQMSERRVLDMKVPLIIHFQDGNKKNYSLDNINLLCYNCYFLFIGNIFTDKEIHSLETFETNLHGKEPTWEVDDFILDHFKNLGLVTETPNTGSDFVSYI